MSAHRNFAQIYNGKVMCINVFDDKDGSYELANQVARATYGDSAFAVECTNIGCAEGDIYRDSRFYLIDKDGNEQPVKITLTPEQQLLEMQEQLEIANASKVDLETQIAQLQLALAKMYEDKGGSK